MQRVFFFLVLLLLYLPLEAQEKAVKEEQQEKKVPFKAALVLLVQLPDSQDSLVFKAKISGLIKSILAKQDFIYFHEDNWKQWLENNNIKHEDLIKGPNIIKMGQDLDVPLIVSAFYGRYNNKFVFELKAYNCIEGYLLGGTLNHKIANLSAYNMIERTVNRFAEKIKLFKKELKYKEEQKYCPKLILNSKQKDITILSPDGKLYGKTENGKLVINKITIPLEKELILYLRKKGYYQKTYNIKLEEKELNIKLPNLLKKSRFESYFKYSSFEFLGLGFGSRLYFLPDINYLSLEEAFYFQNHFGDGQAPLFHNQIQVTYGQYLFPKKESPLRFGLESGAGIIFSVLNLEQDRFFIDPYLLLAGLFMDINLNRLQFFLRSDLKLSMPLGPYLLGWHLMLYRDVFPPISIGVKWKW